MREPLALKKSSGFSRVAVAMERTSTPCPSATVKDASGLLEGDYADGRRLAIFYSSKDVKSKDKALRAVITKWLKMLEK